jgi:hypothetical protein
MAVGSSLSGGGFRHLRMYQLYDNGIPYASVAGGDPYSGLQIDVAKTFRPTIPEAQVLQITGDDHPKGQIVLPGNETVSAEITTGKSNLAVDAVLSGVSVVTAGDQKFMLRESNKRGCESVVGLLAYQQAIDNVVGSATRGNTIWRAMWMPKARVVPLGGPMEEGNALENRYMAYASVVNAHLWGMLFVDGTEGATEAQLIEHFFNGPPMLDAWLINDVPLLTLDLSGVAKANEAGDDFDINVYLWANATGLVTDITAACTLAADAITAVGPVEDDIVMAVYSQAGCL